jgi:hypothetical protein
MSKPTVETRLAALETRVAHLTATVEGGRPGRKALPILVSEEGVCGVDPDSNSEVCPFASIYRHQKGCRGEACAVKSSEYYKEYRRAKRDGGD